MQTENEKYRSDDTAVSNSDLTAFMKEYYQVEDPENIEFNYAFGSLVDARLTELRAEVLRVERSYPFEGADLRRAEDMATYCKRDDFIKRMLKHAESQTVIKRVIEMSYDGNVWHMPCKGKLDLIIPRYKLGLDFKTTAATTQKQFQASINLFNWDRQAAFYMDLAELNRFWIVGISKKNSQIFRFAIERNDDIYLAGKAKYSYWCYKYQLLFN